MKDIKSILSAFSHAQKEGKKTVLATLVRMEGISHRRPCTRILIEEDGRLSGAVNGRLEGQSLGKILSAIKHHQNKLITFDPADPGDANLIRKMGARGTVRLLVEPIQAYKSYNPIELLRQVVYGRQDTVLVSLFSLEHDCHPGTSLLYRPNLLQSTLPLAFQANVIKDAQEALENKTSPLKQYNCGAGRCNALIEFIPQTMPVMADSRGNIAYPMVGIGAGAGRYTGFSV